MAVFTIVAVARNLTIIQKGAKKAMTRIVVVAHILINSWEWVKQAMTPMSPLSDCTVSRQGWEGFRVPCFRACAWCTWTECWGCFVIEPCTEVTDLAISQKVWLLGCVCNALLKMRGGVFVTSHEKRVVPICIWKGTGILYYWWGYFRHGLTQ